jgi:hypothetical protein
MDMQTSEQRPFQGAESQRHRSSVKKASSVFRKWGVWGRLAPTIPVFLYAGGDRVSPVCVEVNVLVIKSSDFSGRTGSGRNLFISYQAAYRAEATLILSQQHDWGRWQNDQS